MLSLRKEEREAARRRVEQIDIIEQQYGELMREYADAKSIFQKLRFKRDQIKKQIDNLTAAIEREENV
jgi:uncharacterized protein involved in exopolysaccharide biosynthesis